MQFRSAIKIRIGCAGGEQFDNEIDDITHTPVNSGDPFTVAH